MPSRKNDDYELDDDGYVVVEFKKLSLESESSSADENESEESSDISADSEDEITWTDDEDEIVIEYSDEEEEPAENLEPVMWWTKAGVKDEKLITAVTEMSLTKESILNFELTDLVRGAYHNEYMKKAVGEILGFRPLPLVLEVRDSRGEMVAARLFPHQVKALTFMREREAMNPRSSHGIVGGIICLHMGMGKTLTAATHSLISPRPPCTEKFGENGFPTLVVASKTVMMEWKSQGFEKFFPKGVKILYLHEQYLGKEIHKITRRQIVKYDFVITSYDTCSGICRKRSFHEDVLEMGDEHTLMKGKIAAIHTRRRDQADRPAVCGAALIYTTPWERVICDESQRFANPDTKTYRHIMAIYGRYKWCLTGTPIRNYDTDIWSQLRFCGYSGVERKIEWKRVGVEKMRTHNLSSAILNMNYADAGITLPAKHEHEMFILLDDKEKECYQYVQGVACTMYDKMMQNLCDFASILALFTRLRQCSIAPYLITAESKREKGTAAEQKKDKEATDMLKQIYEGSLGAWVHDKNGTAGIYSKKMSETVLTLGKIPKGEKVLVFSMFTSVLDLLDDACKARIPEFKFLQIDGDTKGLEREEILGQFRTDPDIQGLFITYKVGSEGLNLTEATHVVCIEPWWTDAVHRQAKARCHRVGQTREVDVHNIYVKDSIEERVVEICKEKNRMAEEMLEGTGQRITVGLDKYTLGRILGIRD
jgi:SNF2 family DNA or RNA helicase